MDGRYQVRYLPASRPINIFCYESIHVSIESVTHSFPGVKISCSTWNPLPESFTEPHIFDCGQTLPLPYVAYLNVFLRRLNNQSATVQPIPTNTP